LPHVQSERGLRPLDPMLLSGVALDVHVNLTYTVIAPRCSYTQSYLSGHPCCVFHHVVVRR